MSVVRCEPAEVVKSDDAGLDCGPNAQRVKPLGGTPQCTCAPFFEGDGKICTRTDSLIGAQKTSTPIFSVNVNYGLR